MLLRGGLISTVVIEDVTEMQIAILLVSRGLQTVIDLLNHVVRSFFAQQHYDKFYNIVNEKVYIPMSNLLVLLLFESSNCILHDVALSANKIANFVNCFFI